MNNVFKIYFFLFAVVFGAMYGIEENENTCYKRLIRNQPLRMLTSAVIGGLSAMGLKYSINNNKFLSLRLPEKIKSAPYWQFIAPGMIFGRGLYEWGNHRFMKRQKKKWSKEAYRYTYMLGRLLENRKPRGESKKKAKKSIKKRLKEKIDYNKEITITYVCPDSLYRLLTSDGLLKTRTGKNIEELISQCPIELKISGGEIEKYCKNNFRFYTIEKRFSAWLWEYVQNAEYAVALFLVNEEQKEKFEGTFQEVFRVQKELQNFKDASPEFNDLPRIYKLLKTTFKKSGVEDVSLLYKLYEIKPNSKKNLWCYALPLEVLDCEKYNIDISFNITAENIQDYAFKLPEEDAQKIKFDGLDMLEWTIQEAEDQEILGVAFFSRTNPKIIRP